MSIDQEPSAQLTTIHEQQVGITSSGSDVEEYIAQLLAVPRSFHEIVSPTGVYEELAKIDPLRPIVVQRYLTTLETQQEIGADLHLEQSVVGRHIKSGIKHIFLLLPELKERFESPKAVIRSKAAHTNSFHREVKKFQQAQEMEPEATVLVDFASNIPEQP